MKKWAIIGGAALVAIVAVVALVMRPKPKPVEAPRVERPTGPDPAHLARVAALVKRIEEFEEKGSFKEALAVLKELAALEPRDPRLADFRSRLEAKQKKLEAWLGAMAKAEDLRKDAARRNSPADWQKVIEAGAEAEKHAATEEQRARSRTLGVSAGQHRDWALAREEEKKGKIDEALRLVAQAIAATEPPAELVAYKTSLERLKRREEFLRVASAARAEGAAPKAYELWKKARALADDPKDVEETESRIHALLPWVDPAERDRRYDAALKAGDDALAAGELDAAEKAYKEAKALKVSEPKPAQGLVRISAARREAGVATAVAEAKAAEARGAWADAVEAYERALRLKPGDGILTARHKELVQSRRPPRITIRLSEGTGLKMDFVLVKRGKFMMGDAAGGADEKPREVVVEKDFWMGTTEVTQAQWQTVMDTKPWLSASVPIMPVEGISWEEAVKFIDKVNLTLEDELKGRRAGLPSEAEWEFACRAGTQTRWSFGNDEGQIDLFAWTTKNAGRSPQAVGAKRPNAWGLFDMHGNVAEWCVDEAGKTADESIILRAVRGGSWNDRAENCRSARRGREQQSKGSLFLGFRVVLR